MNFKEHQQYTISEEKSESQELRDNNLIIIPMVKSRIGRSSAGISALITVKNRSGKWKYTRRTESPLVRILILIKVFELDISVRKAARHPDLSYNTICNLFDLFRQSIAGSDLETDFVRAVISRGINRIFRGRGKVDGSHYKDPGLRSPGVWGKGQRWGYTKCYRIDTA